MANDLNRCEFIGRLGKDPTTRYTQDGKAVVNFSIAVSQAWKKDGEKQEKTTWVPIVAFGKLAEICSEYLRKGSQVFVAGEFQVRKWQDKEGKDRYTTEIVGDQLQMLGGRTNDDDAPRDKLKEPTPGASDFDDDLPF